MLTSVFETFVMPIAARDVPTMLAECCKAKISENTKAVLVIVDKVNDKVTITACGQLVKE